MAVAPPASSGRSDYISNQSISHLPSSEVRFSFNSTTFSCGSCHLPDQIQFLISQPPHHIGFKFQFLVKSNPQISVCPGSRIAGWRAGFRDREVSQPEFKCHQLVTNPSEGSILVSPHPLTTATKFDKKSQTHQKVQTSTI